MTRPQFATIPALLLSAVLLAGCSAADRWTTLTPPALPLAQNVLNPGRGFYDGSSVDLWNPDPDAYARVRDRGLTLAYADATWLPGDHVLSDDELARLQEGLDLVRESGFKLILRFRYSDQGDADWSVISGDLEKLAPLIRDNADVIAVLQAGFLGRWGEWHCWEATTVCHDGAAEKAYVLDKLLAALEGTDVPVAVRYPPDKSRYLGDVQFDDYDAVPPPPPPVGSFADGLGENEKNRARIAHHNDCFLSSADDMGTYPNEPPERIEQWRTFTYAENEFLPYGGESCVPADVDDPERSSGPNALAEMARAGVDYLNADYHPDMLAGWRADGVYDEIAARLGYRLVLEEVAWSEPAAGRPWQLRLTVRNDGFSRLKRRYQVFLVLAGASGERTVPLELDLRRVAPGQSQTYAAELTAPPAGSWRLGLAVRDPAQRLAERAEYSIRFANKLDYDGVNWLGSLSVR
ncbi:DUF4832 domain-containing protein [Oceanithermus sp.]